MTNQLVHEWKEEVLFPSVKDKTLLMLDSWNGYGTGGLLAGAPPGKEIKIMIIPKSTTGMIQPLDVYGNRPWENFVRHFSDFVVLHAIDYKLYQRENIIRMVSLVYDQLQSPRFKSLWRYSFFKSGYVQERPPEFHTPVHVAFKDHDEIECDVCFGPKMLNCTWCLRSLCFHHFVIEYHRCKFYVPQR